LLAATRLRRADPRSGWLIAVGGAFAVIAVAFSGAAGILHPYYVSLLAPFTAALAGAGVAQVAAWAAWRGRWRRSSSPPGWGASWPCWGTFGDRLAWLATPLTVVCALAAAGLAVAESAALRRALLGVALAALLAAPAAWSVATLGHAADGTFPAGGRRAPAAPLGRAAAPRSPGPARPSRASTGSTAARGRARR
jgi:hypothetical protein